MPAPWTWSTGGAKLVQNIEALSKDLVPRVEVDRAKKLLADLEQNAAIKRQEWRSFQRRPDPGPSA